MNDNRDKTLLDTLSMGCNGNSYAVIVQHQKDEPCHYNEWTVQNVDELYEKVEAYITANYTPNTKLKALIEASEKLNLEFHGRPDCKNCALQEQLAELTKAKESV